MLIDTSFDFRTDAGGKDPDSHSPTLRKYHQFLWSKALPGGQLFNLEDEGRRGYLRHASDLGTFHLCSDSFMQTFTGWGRLRPITQMLSEEENDTVMKVGYSIGGMIVFPGVKIGGKQTINGARGFNGKIRDRFDLTLECIRRHYRGERSPLGETLARYHYFFELFEDFRGYVDFFLLQDMVTRHDAAVTFLMPFDDFKTPAVPKDIDTYRGYLRRSIEAVEARNRRIERYTTALATG